ncbi:hypothetical protein ACIRPP_22575 [Streptomyces sp. NPDC101219]|uniref:hypothetical protein n=1 Tax=Streptomyces sp. NPDC101219 TaxID=3366131 RepID=UPI003802B94C
MSSPVTSYGSPPTPTTPEPSNLDVAIRVAQRILAAYGDSSRVGSSCPEACGAQREALRIALRALGADNKKGPGLVRTPGEQHENRRCPAAHPDDPTPCTGRPTVTVLDWRNAGADGCRHHSARLLAPLDGGRVCGLPHATHGTAIAVCKAAADLRPFPWNTDAPRARPEQLSRMENRVWGEAR